MNTDADFQKAASMTALTEEFFKKADEVAIPLILWAPGLVEGPGPGLEARAWEMTSLKKKLSAFFDQDWMSSSGKRTVSSDEEVRLESYSSKFSEPWLGREAFPNGRLLQSHVGT